MARASDVFRPHRNEVEIAVFSDEIVSAITPDVFVRAYIQAFAAGRSARAGYGGHSLIEISLDDTSTWPAQLLACLEEHQSLLRGYEQSEKKLMDDNAWGRPYLPMALRPPNPFNREKEQFLRYLEAEHANNLALRGFHCTRLTDDEVEIIRTQGMTPPDPAMLHARIRAIEKAGLITPQNASELIALNDASNPTRAKRIWFVFTQAPLRQSGVQWLLRYWGLHILLQTRGSTRLTNSHERPLDYANLINNVHDDVSQVFRVDTRHLAAPRSSSWTTCRFMAVLSWILHQTPVNCTNALQGKASFKRPADDLGNMRVTNDAKGGLL
jgi:hypothetical protein